ncbi:hypothetical protein F4780DRAFT_9225 [Xylariomycetidae sp. FL0641]|nr:hypothetical protein F4780DRAFT_9225 [Xylariomycetidae sp. FL0641]
MRSHTTECHVQQVPVYHEGARNQRLPFHPTLHFIVTDWPAPPKVCCMYLTICRGLASVRLGQRTGTVRCARGPQKHPGSTVQYMSTRSWRLSNHMPACHALALIFSFSTVFCTRQDPYPQVERILSCRLERQGGRTNLAKPFNYRRSSATQPSPERVAAHKVIPEFLRTGRHAWSSTPSGLIVVRFDSRSCRRTLGHMTAAMG